MLKYRNLGVFYLTLYSFSLLSIIYCSRKNNMHMMPKGNNNKKVVCYGNNDIQYNSDEKYLQCLPIFSLTKNDNIESDIFKAITKENLLFLNNYRNHILSLNNIAQSDILSFSIESKKYNSFKKLINIGININNLDSSGCTPLHKVLGNKEFGMLRFLLKNNANTEIKDIESKMTPLEFSVLKLQNQVYIEELIEYNADVNVLDSDGFSLLDNLYQKLEINFYNKEVYERLRQAGAAHINKIALEYIFEKEFNILSLNGSNSNRIYGNFLKNTQFVNNYLNDKNFKYKIWLGLQHPNINLRILNNYLNGSLLHILSKYSCPCSIAYLLNKKFNVLHKIDHKRALDVVPDDDSKDSKLTKKILSKGIESARKYIKEENKNNSFFDLQTLKSYFINKFINNNLSQPQRNEKEEELLDEEYFQKEDFIEEPLYKSIITPQGPIDQNKEEEQKEQEQKAQKEIKIKDLILQLNQENINQIDQENKIIDVLQIYNLEYQNKVKSIFNKIEVEGVTFKNEYNDNFEPGAIKNNNINNDIISIIIQYLPKKINFLDEDKKTLLDIAPPRCISRIYYELLRKGAFHSEEKIEKILEKEYDIKPSKIDNSLILEFIDKCDLDAILLCLGHANIKNVKISTKNNQNIIITDFSNPLELALELMEYSPEYAKLKPGFNINGKCPNLQCELNDKYQWLNYGFKGLIPDNINEILPLEYDYEELKEGGFVLSFYISARRKCQECRSRLLCYPDDKNIKINFFKCKFLCGSNDNISKNKQYVVFGETSSFFPFNLKNSGNIDNLITELRTSK
ncbi:MAG: hypothetical protein GY830_01945 [Bacteroidetes bacterium]|nr:hypothetical protein [Bacteroidota bacterium]